MGRIAVATAILAGFLATADMAFAARHCEDDSDCAHGQMCANPWSKNGGRCVSAPSTMRWREPSCRRYEQCMRDCREGGGWIFECRHDCRNSCRR